MDSSSGRFSAEEVAKRAKMNLEDPEGLGLKTVVLKIDNTKAEIIEAFHQMSLQQASREGLGFFVAVIGFCLTYEDNESQLEAMKAPVSIEGIHHAYHLTVDGYPVCFNHLVLHHALNAILIHHVDDEMDDKSKEIRLEHVNVGSNWLPFEVKGNDGHSHLVYYPFQMTVMDLTLLIKFVRE